MTVRRLVITGSECTGKSTLAGALAARYDAPLAPEFAREYAAAKDGPIEACDHWPIVRGQLRAQEAALARAAATRRPLVVFDTDLLSTVTYAQHYTGQCDEDIERLARERLADHYLLLDIDVPWVPDGVRDRETRREELHAHFRHTLDHVGAPFTRIRGSWDDRLAAALRATDALLHSP
jgi:NadR type nicotinamide-nucleotide adenylyltransferase